MKYIILFLIPFNLFGQQVDTLLLPAKILAKQTNIFIWDYSNGEATSVFYFTDGEKLINQGAGEKIDSLTRSGSIPKAKYVFVSTLAPESREDLRNDYFFCNESYVHFFEQELIPAVELSRISNVDRFLIGISFGALNAAYFAAQTDSFGGYGMLSPITYPCTSLNEKLAFSSFENYKVFLSTGTTDAENYVRDLAPILSIKTNQLRLVTTKGGHDFSNWNQQLGDLINFMHQ